jgi:hypothetical protein
VLHGAGQGWAQHCICFLNDSELCLFCAWQTESPLANSSLLDEINIYASWDCGPELAPKSQVPVGTKSSA